MYASLSLAGHKTSLVTCQPLNALYGEPEEPRDVILVTVRCRCVDIEYNVVPQFSHTEDGYAESGDGRVSSGAAVDR